MQRFLGDATLSKVAHDKGAMSLDEEAYIMRSPSLNTTALWNNCYSYK